MKNVDQKKHVVRCYTCCKAIFGRLPKGGDGSILVPNFHFIQGAVCDGSYLEAHVLKSKSELLISEEKRYGDYLI